MDCKGMEESELRTRSFRNEDYNNRRVFLRSYPLQWGGEDEETKEETVRVTNASNKTKPVKKIILCVLEWGGGKVLILRKFKHKIAFYVIACLPVGFKPPTGLISA